MTSRRHLLAACAAALSFPAGARLLRAVPDFAGTARRPTREAAATTATLSKYWSRSSWEAVRPSRLQPVGDAI